jgi:hypothetical protein
MNTAHAKTATITFGFLFLAALIASAAPADVTYIEGDASIRTRAGAQSDAQIGDKLQTGDTLRTGKDGQAELDQKGVVIKIAHGTVFTLMEKPQGTQTGSVLSVALGSIKFRYDKITGTEPSVRTNGASAGVRGTEFSVFAGADGSTLIAVDSGLVTVESNGKSVDVAANQGVEVPLGKEPGDPFTVQRDQIDYAKWNADKVTAMMADPEAALTSIETAMSGYIKDVQTYADLFAASSAKLKEERAARVKVADEQGSEAGQKYESDVVFPLMNQTVAVGLNLRYSTLAALSLRRFVAGRLYVSLKAQFITRMNDPVWTEFTSRYADFLSSFEVSVAPHLVEADI